MENVFVSLSGYFVPCCSLFISLGVDLFFVIVVYLIVYFLWDNLFAFLRVEFICLPCYFLPLG